MQLQCKVNLTRHVPNLCLVCYAAAENAAACGSISIVVARVQIRNVLHLLLQRQLIESLTQGELTVHGLLRNAKVGDIEETLGADGLD